MWFWILFIITLLIVIGKFYSEDFTPAKAIYASGNPDAHYIGCFSSTLEPHKYPTVNTFRGTKSLDECTQLAKDNGDHIVSMRDSLHYKRASCWTGPHANYTYGHTTCTGQGTDSYGRRFGGIGQDAFYAIR